MQCLLAPLYLKTGLASLRQEISLTDLKQVPDALEQIA